MNVSRWFPERRYRGFLWVYFLYFFAIGILHPYLFIYLRQQGLSESITGVAASVAHLVLLVSLPLWGMAGDYSGRPHRVIQCAALAAAVCSFGFLADMTVLWVFVLVPMFYATEYAVEPLTNAAAMQSESPDDSGKFGLKRLWGSLGFVAATPISGYLAQEAGLRVVFPVYALVMTGLVIQTRHLASIHSLHASVSGMVEGLSRALRVPQYRWLLLFLVLWGIPLTGNFTAFGWYWEDLGGQYQGLGWLWMLAALFEVPLFLITVRLLDSISYRGLLVLSSLAGGARWLLYIVLPSREWFYWVQPLHAVMYVGFSVGSVYMIDRLSDPVIRNTGQGLVTSCVFGAGAALGNAWAGVGYDFLGPVIFYGSLGVIEGVCAIVGIWKLRVNQGS